MMKRKLFTKQGIVKTILLMLSVTTLVFSIVSGTFAWLVAETKPVPVLRVGVEDTFGKSGPALELLEIYGLNAENICKKAKAVIANKQ
jgi:transketolase